MTLIEEERIKQDLIETIKLMQRNNGIHGIVETLSGSSPFKNGTHYEGLYINATEDMASYYKQFHTTDSFLTIGASGEQVVNAIHAGAKKIDVYDSNRLCRHALYLRLAAIKALSYEEFLKFYKDFNYKTFTKVAECLSEEERAYWKGLYQSIYPTAFAGEAIAKLLFTYKRLDDELIKRINPYLNHQNFQKLKTIIDAVEITYIDSDLYHLPSHIEGKSYDAINCSNIYEYLNYSSDVKYKHAKRYRNFIMNELYPHLNPNGTILVSYLYAWSDELKKDFDKILKESKGYVVPTGAINLEQYFLYLQGLTSQNLAYSYLFDAFQEDPVEKIATNHVEYGQSKDMSHDLALILRKR